MSKRIQDMKSPLAKQMEKVTSVLRQPFDKLSLNQKFWIGFGLLCLITTLLVHNPLWRSAGNHGYRLGDVALETITSPADIYFVDEEKTEEVRASVRETIKPIFIYEPRRADEAVQTFLSAWEE